MSHTLPDYTTKYKMVKIFGQIDSAELAARLGSLSLLDRRGSVILYDNFEAAGMSGWKTGFSAGGSCALSTTQAFTGNQSMKTVTDVDVGDYSGFHRDFCLPIERRFATEVMFCITGGKPNIRFGILGYTGTLRLQAQIKYDYNVNKLYYYNSAGAWVELAIVDSTNITYEPWLFLKVVVDWDKGEYVRLIFCSTEYDLSNLDIRSFADASPKHIYVSMITEAGTAAAATVYFDNFILTQNEP
jgi:hypothetical protein